VGEYFEERVIFEERFQARTLDFRGRSVFTRYDGCEFVKCELLIDDQTEHLAFTGCTFEDCNITELKFGEDKPLVADGNIFKLPIEVRTADLGRRLTEALATKL
jgi:hypothetical protein